MDHGSAAAVEIRLESPDDPVAATCIAAYLRELDQRIEGGLPLDLAKAVAPGEMEPPDGAFFVASIATQPVGCVGLRRIDEHTGEIKRMWTAPEARGRGVAGVLLAAAATHARESGCLRLRLDTNRALTEAQAFYRRHGFSEIDRYNDNPHAHHWFEMLL